MNALDIKKLLVDEQPFSICVVYITASLEKHILEKHGDGPKGMRIREKHFKPMNAKLDTLLRAKTSRELESDTDLRIAVDGFEARLSVLDADAAATVLAEEFKRVSREPLITLFEKYGEILHCGIHLDICVPEG